MSDDRWQQLNELFHSALNRPDGERTSYLARACAGDDELRRELEELLDANARAESGTGDFDRLERSLDPVGTAAVTGRRLGPYRLLEELGSGGMGAVWLAERADGQFEQRVAIKLIKRGMDTAQILERFKVERQILASLDHPHIARLLDGGTTDDGLPYFVMEHIEGRPIDAHAADRQLSVRARLELFLQVCDAVSYAHQHLIVHRDIKPQNILVTAGGVPKLLDFGIAKVLQGAGEQGTRTISGHQLLTPEYASPEQVEGRHTTTQTDVYSLGVVLYELLTGLSPYRPRTWSTTDVCESVRSGEVERPSTAVARPVTDGVVRRRGRPIEPAGQDSHAESVDRVRGQLRGDLDAIVLAALRKEPERRYGSVEQLANDIRRHLTGLPVRARTDSVWYRARKFARRNRAAVVAAALVGVTLVGGIVATAWQARNARQQAELARQAQARAERRFAEVRKLANVLLFDYHDAIKDLPGSTPVRERLVRDALEYLNRLAEEGGGDPTLQRELGLAYRRVADVQANASGGSLGDTAGAIGSHRKSLEVFQALLSARPDDRTARLDVARGTLQLARLVSITADQQEALRLATRAAELLEELITETAPTVDDRLALAGAYDTVGTILLESGKPREALAAFERQQRLLESTPESDRQRPDIRRALSVAYQHLADAQSTFGDQTAALQSFEHSLQLRLALSAEFPINTDYRALVSNAQYWIADTLVKMGRLREALASYLRSLAIAEQLAAADPVGHRLTFSLLRIGNVLARLGEHERALAYYRRAEAATAADSAADPENLWTRGGLIESRAFMCASLVSLGRYGEEGKCAETRQLIDATKVEPTNAVIRASLARSLTVMADAFAAAGTRAQSAAESRRLTQSAQDLYRKSVAIWADMSRLGMLTPSDDEEAALVSRSLDASNSALARLGASEAASAPPTR
jgi:serine/threonine protein kinase/tetratricopeptide (TPR) repeat protein